LRPTKAQPAFDPGSVLVSQGARELDV